MWISWRQTILNHILNHIYGLSWTEYVLFVPQDHPEIEEGLIFDITLMGEIKLRQYEFRRGEKLLLQLLTRPQRPHHGHA